MCGLEQDWNIASASAMELLQSCTKKSIYTYNYGNTDDINTVRKYVEILTSDSENKLAKIDQLDVISLT